MDLVTGDTWPKRRRVIYIALVFCGLVIAYCLGAATAIQDAEAIRAASENAFWYGAAIIFAYVFGSVVDDFDKRRRRPKPASEQEPVE